MNSCCAEERDHGNELKALLVDSLIIDHLQNKDGISAGFLSHFFNKKITLC